MISRVTQNQISNFARLQLTQQTSEMAKKQQEVSTGLRIHRPSDDPTGLRRSLIQKDRLERLESHLTSIQATQSRLSNAAVQLQDANTVLVRARSIALQAPQLTDKAEIDVMVSELNGILERLTSVANSKDEYGYLFSGTASNTQPFPTADAGNGQAKYAGASSGTELLITGDPARGALLPGDQVFQPVARGATLLIGSTGAQTGTGTDTAIGMKQLTVSHVATTYGGTSGVTAGASSANGDTIIGATGTHRLQINDSSGTGTSGTLSLNGGPVVSFTDGDTNLLVKGARGEMIYVDTTAIAVGFNGSVDITATGAMSIDGGLTTTPISFTGNDIITDSRDGSTVNINSTGIVRTGNDELEFPGTADVFNAIRALRDDLLNTRNLSTAERVTAFNRRLADIERVHDHVLNTIGIQSVSQQQIVAFQSRTEELQLSGQQEYSETVSADIIGSITRLQELTNLQQFTMAAVSKLLTPNLLNYIQ